MGKELELISRLSGIGLAYTAELVKMHGGRLDVESRTEEESEDGSRKSISSGQLQVHCVKFVLATTADGSIFKVTIP
jgi:signal transduction histidine kinase